MLSLGEIRTTRATYDKLGPKMLAAINGGNEFTKFVIVEPDGTETEA